VATTQANAIDTIERFQTSHSLFDHIETLTYNYMVDKDKIKFSWKDKQGNTDSIEVSSTATTEEIYQLITTTLRMTYGCNTEGQEGSSSKT
jgi:hypothetical protein